jgi:Cu2+-containing amine oxidase
MLDSKSVVGSLFALALLGPVTSFTGPPTAPAQAPPPSSSPSEKKPGLGEGAVAAEDRSRHPLDPLSPDEIRLAVSILRDVRALGETFKFVSVALNEPAKALVLHPKANSAIPREARLVLLDRATGVGYEAQVNLSARSVPRFEALPKGVQPPIMMDEFGECEVAAKRSQEFREALKKRGVEDMSLVMVDAWSAGHYGDEPSGDRGKRLVRALTWVKADANDNGYAHPVEGLITVIDLNRKEVVRVLGPRGRGPTAGRPQAAGGLPGRRAELLGERAGGPLAEVGVPGWVQPSGGPGSPHRRV